jgi:hypothetical protein
MRWDPQGIVIKDGQRLVIPFKSVLLEVTNEICFDLPPLEAVYRLESRSESCTAKIRHFRP